MAISAVRFASTHVLLAAVAAGALASAASAAVLTETQTIPSGPTDIVQTQNFAQFDPALGTLTGVKVTASASQGPPVLQMTWNNTTPSPSGRSFRYAFDWTASIKQGVDTITSGSAEAPVGSDPFNPFTNWGTIAAPAGYAQGQSILYQDLTWGLSISNMVNVLPVNFTPYVGVGTVPFDIRIENVFGISTPSGWSFQLTTNGQSSVTVEYTYTPVPAPGAAALLGLGGLMAARRRR